MNDIMNKCWLVWHTFMQDIHLKQHEFTYSALAHLLNIEK